MKYLKTVALYLKSHTHKSLKRFIVLSTLMVIVSAQPAVAELETLFWDSEEFNHLAMISNEAPVAGPQKLEEVVAIVTGYSSTPDQTDDTPEIMASGKKVYEGAAACPRKYKFGTKIEVNGKLYTCEDRMHIRFDDRFDIWYPTRMDAKIHGKQQLNVVVYKS